MTLLSPDSLKSVRHSLAKDGADKYVSQGRGHSC